MKTKIGPGWKVLFGCFVFFLLLFSGVTLASAHTDQVEVATAVAYVTADTEASTGAVLPDHVKLPHVTQRYSVSSTDLTGFDKTKRFFCCHLNSWRPANAEALVSIKEYKDRSCSFLFLKRHIFYCIYRI